MQTNAGLTSQPKFSISPITPAIRQDWLQLFAGYRAFYDAPTDETSLDVVWNWITGETRRLEGFLLYIDGAPCGLLHFREAPDPVAGKLVGFLDDLFVDPAYRCAGFGRLMIDELVAIGTTRGWKLIGWLTDDNNYGARKLYDRVAHKTLWNTYEIDLLVTAS